MFNLGVYFWNLGLTKTKVFLKLILKSLVIRAHIFMLNVFSWFLGQYLDIPNVQFLPTNAEMLMSYGLGHPDNGGKNQG